MIPTMPSSGDEPLHTNLSKLKQSLCHHNMLIVYEIKDRRQTINFVSLPTLLSTSQTESMTCFSPSTLSVPSPKAWQILPQEPPSQSAHDDIVDNSRSLRGLRHLIGDVSLAKERPYCFVGGGESAGLHHCSSCGLQSNSIYGCL
jgi:hypothetical protein